MIRVLLADDQALVRAGFRALLDAQDDIEVVGEATATATAHVNRAMIKLGARDRAQLVVVAYESGLVRPGWAG